MDNEYPQLVIPYDIPTAQAHLLEYLDKGNFLARSRLFVKTHLNSNIRHREGK